MSTTIETPQILPAGTWTVDPVHSQASFAVRYHVGTFRGSFSPLQAKLEVDEDGNARLTGSVPVSGVKVQDENLATHLQSPEFFDAERAPEISFASTAIRPSGDGSSGDGSSGDGSSRDESSGEEIEVEGELTIKGISWPVIARGKVGEQQLYMDRPYFGLELGATLDRTRFGLNWQNPLPNGDPALADEVTVTAELYLTKA
jgi:polyisoprenoid-binding protein YceI